jgi:hypothetical protein
MFAAGRSVMRADGSMIFIVSCRLQRILYKKTRVLYKKSDLESIGCNRLTVN